MYIPDDVWDRYVNEACEVMESLESHGTVYTYKIQNARGMIQSFVNLQDHPLPEPEFESFLDKVKFLLQVKRKS